MTRWTHGTEKNARPPVAGRRAAARYESELGLPCPAGFHSIRAHNLKHTPGHRLRVAGVSFEDRKLLLSHKAQRVTTHYSAPEFRALTTLTSLHAYRDTLIMPKPKPDVRSSQISMEAVLGRNIHAFRLYSNRRKYL